MSISFFQKCYDAIKVMKSPEWFKSLTYFLLHNVIIPSLLRMGQQAILQLENTIKYASQQDWSNEKKYIFVWDEMRKSYSKEQITDNMLGLGIELILAMLKKKGVV